MRNIYKDLRVHISEGSVIYRNKQVYLRIHQFKDQTLTVLKKLKNFVFVPSIRLDITLDITRNNLQ